LMIAAMNGWVLNYDNLSFMPDWLSDDFCRLSTGGSITTRALYTDSDEAILRAKRPVIVNGIGDIVGRADLLDRAITVTLPTLATKRPERELRAEFDAALPSLLGALLAYISGGLRELKNIPAIGEFRMADAVEMALACERGEGCDAVFLDAYRASLCSGKELVLEKSPIVAPLLELIKKKREWTGSAATLLDSLNDIELHARPPKGWPGAPHTLSAVLKRLKPALRDEYGIEIEWGSTGRGSSKARSITLTLNDAGKARVDAEEAAEKAKAEATPVNGSARRFI
jgi:hypothetical protein